MSAKSSSSGKIMPSPWLSVHLHYNDHLDPLLKTCIKPLFEKLLKGDAFEKCRCLFFIRYKAKGPHLRLRFLPADSVNRDKLLESIIYQLDTYIKKHPSKSTTPGWALELPTEQAWLLEDQILIEPYQRETIRYGGLAAMEVAEQQFMASSMAVLAALEQCPVTDNDYQYKLGLALQMHLGFLFSLGLSLYQSALLMDYFKSQWIDHAYTLQKKPGDSTTGFNTISQQRNKSSDKFMVQFNKQKESLLASHHTIWQGLVDGHEISDRWYAQWIKHMQVIGETLETLWQQKRIARSIAARSLPLPFRLTDHQASLWPIYSSYIHMTNNRLGIANHDEAYLAYMMARSLKCLAFDDTSV